MAQDDRLKGKPSTNDGSLPRMTYDYKDMPLIAENIWHAQKAGWPTILTYDHVDASTITRSKKRYANIVQSGVIRSRKSSADEYPFASTVENAGSTFIGHAPKEEQDKQGGLISAFYARHKAASATKPFWFEVEVKNYPVAKQKAAEAK
jgi:hypothetical protein